MRGKEVREETTEPSHRLRTDLKQDYTKPQPNKYQHQNEAEAKKGIN